MQESASTLLLRSAAHGREAAAGLRRGRLALAHFLERQGASRVRIHCRCGEPAMTERSGKARRVIAASP